MKVDIQFRDFQLEQKMKLLKFYVCAFLICTIILIVCLFATHCFGAEIMPPDNLWKGLVGEAANQGYEGMYAVACVVRNRLNAGMNTGLVALKRRGLDEFVRKQGRKVEFVAKDIVEKVFVRQGKDITQEATHYENVERFGTPEWTKTMVKTVKIGSHTFYKERG